MLPSEAQWEYARRAGTSGPFAGTGNLDDMGWYAGNSGNETHDVGTKQANDFGLHDMHGNVFEWCRDPYYFQIYTFWEEFLSGPDPVAPLGLVPGAGEERTIRGGSFFNFDSICRSAFRYPVGRAIRLNRIGFRPVMPLP